jgi:hypothetical protein
MFHGWDNFFLMIGPAAGSLIGLLFVVVTLTAGRDREVTLRGAALYLTPTVFDFGMVLAVSAAAMAPGLSPHTTALVIGALAVWGLGYTLLVGARLYKADTDIKPHWSDVWMYGAMPPLVFLALLAADGLELIRPQLAPYAIAVVLMGILFMGIRNAWDLITWMAPMAGQPFPAETAKAEKLANAAAKSKPPAKP